MSERRRWVTQPELRMNAYYYSFNPTGIREIDEILSAVACAGKAYHHTNYWGDQDDGEPSYIELIQEAADRAAAKMKDAARVIEEEVLTRDIGTLVPKEALVPLFMPEMLPPDIDRLKAQELVGEKVRELMVQPGVINVTRDPDDPTKIIVEYTTPKRLEEFHISATMTPELDRPQPPTDDAG